MDKKIVSRQHAKQSASVNNMPSNELENEEQRLRNLLLEQIKRKNVGVEFNQLSQSPDAFEEIKAGSESLDEEEDISNLFLRQKSNDSEFYRLQAVILKKKQLLAQMEQDLEQKTNLGVEINQKIKSNFESCFVSDFERLNRMSEERNKWKVKLNQRTIKAKERIKSLKENTALFTLQPQLEPKVIPLSPVRTPPVEADPSVELSNTRVDKNRGRLERAACSPRDSRLDRSSDKKRRSKSSSNKHSSSKKEHKKSKKRSSKDKRLDKLADKLNIDHIAGNGKSNDEAEAELLRRMLNRSLRKYRSTEHPEKRRRKRSKSREESIPSVSRNEDNELVEDPVQSQLEVSPAFYPSVPSFTPTTHPLDTPLQPPTTGLPSYNIPPPVYPYAVPPNISGYSPYVFDHLRIQAAPATQVMHQVPQIVHQVPPTMQPPSTIHSTSQFTPISSTSQEPLDYDMRTSDHDIISLMLQSYPRLCPPNVRPEELAAKLLETNGVEYVAKMLSRAIPDAVKEHYFSPELKHFISSLDLLKK